jgi:ABC-type molybdate transport system substrate-binding protein
VPDGIAVVPIPEMFNRPIEFRVAVAAAAANAELAASFVEHVLSEAGQRVLVELGYVGVGERD